MYFILYKQSCGQYLPTASNAIKAGELTITHIKSEQEDGYDVTDLALHFKKVNKFNYFV